MQQCLGCRSTNTESLCSMSDLLNKQFRCNDCGEIFLPFGKKKEDGGILTGRCKIEYNYEPEVKKQPEEAGLI